MGVRVVHREDRKLNAFLPFPSDGWRVTRKSDKYHFSCHVTIIIITNGAASLIAKASVESPMLS